MARPLFTGSFWLDTLERMIRTFAQVVLGIITSNAAVSDIDFEQAAWTVGSATVICLLMCVVASGVGEPGTASVFNPAPPDTLEG